MPHIDIKCFPRELDEQQKAALAADITDVIIRHLNGFVNGMVASHLLCHSGTINRHSLNGALLS